MRTSNIELLSEIDVLADIKRCETGALEVVKRIDELEKVTDVLFIASSKSRNVYFKKIDLAIDFIKKQARSRDFELIATTFADI